MDMRERASGESKLRGMVVKLVVTVAGALALARYLQARKRSEPELSQTRRSQAPRWEQPVAVPDRHDDERDGQREDSRRT